MLKRFFTTLLRFPGTALVMTTLVVVLLGTCIGKLEIDASSETLLLENDPDLLFTRQMNERFKNADLLIVTFRPKTPLLSKESLTTLSNLSRDLEALNRVESVISILNVPLLQSPVQPIKELVKNIPTLQSEGIEKTLAKQEFLSSPLYKNNLVSADFKTTALILKLNADDRYEQLLEARNALKQKESKEGLTPQEQQELAKIVFDFKLHRDAQREIEHQSILQIRSVIANYYNEAELFLGGVNMIADDMVTFVKNDLTLYGTTLLILLIITLGVIFRQFRWILIPVIICLYSVVATTGMLGLFGWEVTVISSNFISLQLIITISIILHLIVRYRELALKYPKNSQRRLVMTTLLSKANPSFFAIITTIAGFGSLVLSGIKPVINLGWMMSAGIAISLLLGFVLFGAIVVKLPKLTPTTTFENHFALTKWCAYVVLHHGKKIFLGSALILLIGISGASLLKVENSFISYFKPTTEIYKGMEVIDKYLGGTTPLDIIITFKDTPNAPKATHTEKDEFSEFEEEFKEAKNDPKYWFTSERMKQVMKVHNYLESLPEIGNVQSLGTLLEIGQLLNNGTPLDDFQLALLYKELPLQFRKIILDPYVSIENNQIRFTTRIIDSNEHLRRNNLLQKIHKDLDTIITPEIGDHALSSLMVLYNNMLQSLFRSQILTLGFVVLILTLMFWILFRSFSVAMIAIFSNLVPMSIIFGIMGWAGIPLDMMTITIAAISIGIGVDDTIHYIHRFKDELRVDGNYENAMKRSHNSIGYAMYYTSFAIILGFSVLVVSNFIPTIYFGLLTVLVMFMALMGALLLLPKLLLTIRPF